MPTPLEFMTRVLAWPGLSGSGWVNLHWSLHKAGDDRPRWRGQPFKTADELINKAQSLAMAPADKAEDVYFCTSVQSQTDTVKFGDRTFTVASRHASTATLLKAIWLDIDVKDPPKGYATKQEAWDAVQQFLKDAALPQPSAIVWSGGGMHVYWISDTPLTVAEWEPFAQGLKLEAQRCGLRCDYGVTTDAARILRVPGTYNRKIPGNPRPVKVAGLGPDYSFAVDLAHLRALGEPHVTAAVTKPAPFDMSAFKGYTPAPGFNGLTDKLSDGIDRYSDLPLEPWEVLRNCGHFRDAATNKGQGHGQGLWMLTVLASTWFEDPRKWAHQFSKGYPSYDPAETDAMFDRKMDERAKGLGWPSCKSFENEGSKSCATCPFRPQGKSPLNLAARVKPPEPAQPAVQVVTNPITRTVLTEDDLRLPKGYCLRVGQICKQVNVEEDPKKPPDYVYIPIFMGEVISKPQISAHRPPTLFFKYKQGDNFEDVVIKWPALKTDQTLHDAFYEMGVLVNPDADRYVRHFMRSWVGRIDMAVKRLTTEPLGWIVENGIQTGFAYGGRLFHKDGTEEDSDLSGEWFQKFVPSGEESYVHKAMRVTSDQMNPGLEVIMAQSWASPLVEIAGLKTTAIVWGYSTGSGKGKSTAMRSGVALWGAPDKVRTRGGATATGLENMMNWHKHLPVILDELKTPDQIDKIAAIFDSIGEGGQGAKATRNGGLRQDKFWQLILTCGSNTSLYQYQASKGLATDAAAMRGFEIPCGPSTHNTTKYTMTEVDQLMGALEHNYGHLGLRYAKYLAMNRDAIDLRYQTMDKQVMKDLMPPDGVFPREERFWKTTVTLTLLGAELANEITGTPYFHLDLMRAYLYDVYATHRAWVAKHVTIAGTGLHSEEAWNKLMGLWINNQLVTDRMGTGEGRSSVPVQVFMKPSYERGCVTKIHWLQEPPMIRIAYNALIAAVEEMGGGTAVVDEFQRLYGGKVPRKVYLAGVPLPTETKTRMKVWEIPMTPGHPLYRQWAEKVNAPEPATPASAAMQAQDEGPLAAGMAQAAKDAAVVAGATGA